VNSFNNQISAMLLLGGGMIGRKHSYMRLE